MSDFTLTLRKEGASYDILSHLLFQQIPLSKAEPTLQLITASFGLEMTSRGPLVQPPAQSRSAMRPEQVSPDFDHSGLENLPGMEAEQPPWRILFRCQSTGTKPRLFQCVSRPAPADYSWKSASCPWNPWWRRIFKCLSYCQQPPWVGSHCRTGIVFRADSETSSCLHTKATHFASVSDTFSTSPMSPYNSYDTYQHCYSSWQQLVISK